MPQQSAGEGVQGCWSSDDHQDWSPVDHLLRSDAECPCRVLLPHSGSGGRERNGNRTWGEQDVEEHHSNHCHGKSVSSGSLPETIISSFLVLFRPENDLCRRIRFSLSSTSGDCIEIGNHFSGNLESRRLKVLAKMLYGDVYGDHQDIGRSL